MNAVPGRPCSLLQVIESRRPGRSQAGICLGDLRGENVAFAISYCKDYKYFNLIPEHQRRAVDVDATMFAAASSHKRRRASARGDKARKRQMGRIVLNAAGTASKLPDKGKKKAEDGSTEVDDDEAFAGMIRSYPFNHKVSRLDLARAKHVGMQSP